MRREQPHGVRQTACLCQHGAARLLARHGMTGQKAREAGPVVQLRTKRGDLHLGAADIRYELILFSNGARRCIQSRIDMHRDRRAE